MIGLSGLPEDIAGREAEAAEDPAAVAPVTIVILAIAMIIYLSQQLVIMRLDAFPLRSSRYRR